MRAVFFKVSLEQYIILRIYTEIITKKSYMAKNIYFSSGLRYNDLINGKVGILSQELFYEEIDIKSGQDRASCARKRV